MGFAKYHEDNIKLYDDRMYYKNTSSLFPCVRDNYVPKHFYKYRCPFCNSGFDTAKQIAKHVVVNHGGKNSFVYLNNRPVYAQTESTNCIYSLTIYNFSEKPVEVKIKDDFEHEYTFWTQVGKFEYNIQNYIRDNIYSCLTICLEKDEYVFKQLIDINVASIDKILSGKYVSELFYEQISEELFTQKEYLAFLKMLIHEGRDTSEVMIRINMMNYDWNEDTKQLYWYHYLASEQSQSIPKNELETLVIVQSILLGDLAHAKSLIDCGKIKGNDKAGCLLALGLLAGESLTIDFQKECYEPVGLLGELVKVLEHLYYIESETRSIDTELDELSVFRRYPLIGALIELENAINRGSSITKDTYEILRGVSPFAAITYCRGLDDELAKEKILKSTSKIHANSSLLKRLAMEHDFDWIYRRITVNDGDLYIDAVKKLNILSRYRISNQFIDEFPLSDEILVTPLGGEKTVGASCFVISYHGINVMVDCGINPYKKGEAAYPTLDEYTKQIDYILISHAHIDHSGALVKAHAMWPNAKIYMTAPTRVFVEYLFSDMAKVNNGINSEFEIDIVEIEKNTMIDTLKSINVVDFNEKIFLGEHIGIEFHSAGHIQGAAMIEFQIDGKTILYTGDFATKDQMLTAGLQYTSLPNNVDYLISEATYLGKQTEDKNALIEDLKNKIIYGLNHEKSIILPAMAVGRSQELACIVGTMKLEGLIDDDIQLYLAGMAIPTSTQIIPFMNERYAEVVGQFVEFDGINFPNKKSVVIASSAGMTKGSASYKIANYWKNMNVNFEVLSVSPIDFKTQKELDSFSGGCVEFVHYSLPTHADEEDIKEIIRYTNPKVISFVHQGREKSATGFIEDIYEFFDNDVVIKQLTRNMTFEAFNLYDLIKEENPNENL